MNPRIAGTITVVLLSGAMFAFLEGSQQEGAPVTDDELSNFYEAEKERILEQQRKRKAPSYECVAQMRMTSEQRRQWLRDISRAVWYRNYVRLIEHCQKHRLPVQEYRRRVDIHESLYLDAVRGKYTGQNYAALFQESLFERGT